MLETGKRTYRNDVKNTTFTNLPNKTQTSRKNM